MDKNLIDAIESVQSRLEDESERYSFYEALLDNAKLEGDTQRGSTEEPRAYNPYWWKVAFEIIEASLTKGRDGVSNSLIEEIGKTLLLLERADAEYRSRNIWA